MWRARPNKRDPQLRCSVRLLVSHYIGISAVQNCPRMEDELKRRANKQVGQTLVHRGHAEGLSGSAAPLSPHDPAPSPLPSGSPSSNLDQEEYAAPLDGSDASEDQAQAPQERILYMPFSGDGLATDQSRLPTLKPALLSAMFVASSVYISRQRDADVTSTLRITEVELVIVTSLLVCVACGIVKPSLLDLRCISIKYHQVVTSR